MAEALVKQLTGGDTIAARYLYHEFFEFAPAFKLFLAANHKPTIRGTDYAIWRRVRLIPFTVTIPDEEQDRNLLDKLRAELPGVLNWALAGCAAWQRGGLRAPTDVVAATAEYRAEMDPLAGFLAECCTIGLHEEATAKTEGRNTARAPARKARRVRRSPASCSSNGSARSAAAG